MQWEERGYSEKKERRAANPLCVCPDFFFFLSKKEVETGRLVTMEKNELLKATVILSPYFLIIGTYIKNNSSHVRNISL